MSAMDCGPGSLPPSTYFPPPRLQTHVKNQDSSLSSASHGVMASDDRFPSPRRWSPTFQPRRRSGRQYPNSLSFIPSPALPQSETHEQAPSLRRRLATRAPLTISPFRSVRRMKEPFQLMLPSSPVSLDSAPAFGDKSLEPADPVAAISLRTWSSDQNLNAASLEAFGLLPSPPISDSHTASAAAEESYFDSKAESDTNTEVETVDEDATPGAEESIKNIDQEEKVTYKAYRPPGWEDTEQDQRRTDVTNVHEAHSHFVRHCESIDEPGPELVQDENAVSAASPEPKTEQASILGSSPRVHRARTATMSSEASWIPSNFSYCERWLQCVPHDMLDGQDEHPPEFNRRQFRIVENDPPMPKLDIIPGAKVLDEPVRFAVASKPKLVDIARQSPVPPPLPPPSLLPTNAVPATPNLRQVEVSAFSPDTPLNMSDSGYGTRDSGYSADSFHDDSKDDESYTDPGSLTSDSVTSTVVNDRPESAQGERNISPQPEIRSGSVSPKASSPKSASPQSSELSEKEERENLWNHEWTLDQLDHSVKDFPRHMLRLTSPVVIHIRKNEEKALLRPFRTIFPEVAENLLDCLCAALIARNYLVTLSSIHRRKPSLSQRSGTYAIDSVPTKAYSTLGIQLPSGSPGRIKDRVLGSRSIELRRELEKIVDNLLFAICGRSDAILKSAVEVLAQVLETTALD
ncbi:hypothetical protein N7474_005426 [Penicillium riverlandense]|uniref:uncharacterized protein n=1 Tax=Penicillium riverlandense TaxID=1903569 RepID=UPI0025475998|nr:uncharacterized protein N7474_005426 [Penicillium riverlandense]KAJ5819835.1 hypothetical protein N7474_005426 [Penicillium riverlandense]